jgi:hypothetical protein
VARVTRTFLDDPFGNDFRVFYAAAKVGLGAGWSHIYDGDLLRAASSAFPSAISFTTRGITTCRRLCWPGSSRP